MELKRTFHAIGQGAFYTERFYENKTNVFNVVYDCGTLNAQKNLVYQIHAEFAQRTEIEYLFISHFHKDHISGIKELDRYCSIKNYVVPVISLALFRRLSTFSFSIMISSTLYSSPLLIY